jgi:DNA-binding transcriptional LysR family regulator
MARKRERGTSKKARSDNSDPATLDWEGARLFLEVARHKSFRAATGSTSLSVNTLRRKLSAFEKHLGTSLFARHVDGVRLTEDGERVLAIASRMEAESLEFLREVRGGDKAVEGVVRLAMTEGLASFWVAPRLVDFTEKIPRVSVRLRSTMTPADVLRLEADVAIQLDRPAQKDVRVVKLGRLHLLLFAAKSYLDRHGYPKKESDLAGQSFVAQVAEQIVTQEDYERRLGVKFDRMAFCSNSSSTHYFGIASGIGIGMLPTYAAALGATAIPLDLSIHAYHDIWLVYHPDVSRVPRVRKLIDWLIESFSPRRFPWFADNFVHPRDFPKRPRGMPPAQLFDPFIPDRRR